MSEAAPGDIIIGSGWQQGADGYAGIVVDHGRIVSDSSQGVQNNSSLLEIQRSRPAMIVFRYIGVQVTGKRSSVFANAGFDSNEPRIPAGQSGGGQWTSGMAPSAAILSGGNRWTGPAAKAPAKVNDDDNSSKALGQAARKTGRSYWRTLYGTLRQFFHPDREPSKPKNFSELQEEIDEGVDGMDMTTPEGLGRAAALATVLAAADALSDGDAGSSGPSLDVVLERGPQGVIDRLSSNLEPESLSDVQARDWYNATKVVRAEIIDEMRAAGYSEEEIAREVFELRNAARAKARELMANRQAAEDLEKTNPNITWDQALKKYNGNYKVITQKSLESDEKTNKMIEQKRAAGGNS